jgi:hypothetical protein
MDWIERLFGISPDHGDHSTEFSILMAVICMLVVFVLSRSRSFRHSSRAKK